MYIYGSLARSVDFREMEGLKIFANETDSFTETS